MEDLRLCDESLERYFGEDHYLVAALERMDREIRDRTTSNSGAGGDRLKAAKKLRGGLQKAAYALFNKYLNWSLIAESVDDYGDERPDPFVVRRDAGV